MRKINNNVQNTMFSNTRKFIIEKGDFEEPENIIAALSLNRRLEAYGYTLDAAAIKTLATQSTTQMLKTWEQLKQTITHDTDAFKNARTLYPNFPEEVMGLTEAELYTNSLFYYTFAYSKNAEMAKLANAFMEMRTEDKRERPVLIENFPRNLMIINGATYDDYLKLMNSRMHSLNMSESQFEELKIFFNEDPESFNRLLNRNEAFQSKETLVKIASMLYEDDKKNIDRIATLMKDSVDVLRFAAYLSSKNGETQNTIELRSTDPNKPLSFKLKNDEKRLIKNLLNNCPNLYHDIWKQRELFEKLKNRINPTKEKNCPERVVHAFDNLSNNEKRDEYGSPIQSVERQLNDAIKMVNENNSNGREKLENLSKNFSGIFLAHYIETINKLNPEHRDFGIDLIRNCQDSESIALSKMLTVYNRIKEIEKSLLNEEVGVKVYSHHGDKYYAKSMPKPNLSEENIKAMSKIVLITAENMVKGNQNLKKIYIDPSLKDVKAPLRNVREASGGSVLTKYSKINCTPKKDCMVFGINWEAKTKDSVHLDVDLSVVAYDDKYQAIDRISYYSIKSDFGVHSGDMVQTIERPGKETSAATEAIFVNKQVLKDCDIRYLIPTVTCFSVPSFKSVENLTFMHMDKEALSQNQFRTFNKDGNLCFAGEVFEPSQMEHCIKITTDGTQAVPFIYDVMNDSFIWLDVKIHGDKDLPHIVDEGRSLSTIAAEIELAKSNTYPSMQQLITTFASGNGEITTDITQADTVFVNGNVDKEKLGIKEDARVISSFDLDIISDEFSGNKKIEEVEAVKDEKQKNVIEETEPLLVKQMKYFHRQIDLFPHGHIEITHSFDFDDQELER